MEIYFGVQKQIGAYFARAHVQGDGSRSQERLDRLRSNLVRDRLAGRRAQAGWRYSDPNFASTKSTI